MKRALLPLSFLLLAITAVNAQAPTGYYDSANGLTGYALKTQLKEIIDDVDDADLTTEYLHTDQGYNAMDGFILLYDLDTYYENDNTILDPYSENPDGADPYNFTPGTSECGNYSGEGDCYNKEHVIPQSVFSQASPMRGDAHHLLPTDGRVNGFRSNYPFGVVDDNNLISQSGISNPTQNGSKLGANLNSGYSAGYTGTVFEPIDEFKGDISRIYFYFITRYEDQISNWSSYAMFNGSSDQVLDDTFLNIMLEWNSMDPVSQKEIDRNNNAFTYQNNRNPFIDHPEYIDVIWSTGAGDTVAPTAPTNVTAANTSGLTVQVSWDAATDDVAVTAYEVFMDGNSIGTTSNLSLVTSTLVAETTYCFTVVAKDAAGNTSAESTAACITTPESNGTVSELFFSEYIEGSGTKKALEIANYTGASVSLNNYTIKISSNGNSGWSNTYSFPTNASVSNSDVYVIANSGLTSPCADEADYINNDITSFNGNDAIGLFKDDVLVDIIGTLGDSSNFAQDVTLVRNSNINAPNTTYTATEWTSYPTDTCSDLGSHTINILGNNQFSTATIGIYPNPVTHGVINFNLASNTSITQVVVYSQLGKQVITTNNLPNNQLNVSKLHTGIYLLTIKTANGSTITKKVVIK